VSYITLFHRPYLRSKRGLKVHVSLDGALWCWQPPRGQIHIANSDDSADWLYNHVTESASREQAIIFCTSHSNPFSERMRYEREQANEERLRIKMNSLPNRAAGTHSWDRRWTDSDKGKLV
jgi:hypothetical protein